MQVDYIVHGAITLVGVIAVFVGRQYLTPEKKSRKTDPKMAKVKREVKKRQKYKCYITNRKLKSGDVHHAFCASWFPWLKYVAKYMFYISEKEHNYFHTTFLSSTKDRCTLDDFMLFVEMRRKKLLMSKKEYLAHRSKYSYMIVSWTRFAIVAVVGILILRELKW